MEKRKIISTLAKCDWLVGWGGGSRASCAHVCACMCVFYSNLMAIGMWTSIPGKDLILIEIEPFCGYISFMVPVFGFFLLKENLLHATLFRSFFFSYLVAIEIAIKEFIGK